MITLRQLDCFRKLAVSQHVTKTAGELNITQTAARALILNLEKELGVQLFDRSKRTIRLNDAGRVFLPYISDAFEAIENGCATLQDIDSLKEHFVRVVAEDFSVWSALFQDFCKDHPEYILKQKEATPSQAKRTLLDMEADFVVGWDGDLDDKGIERTCLKKEKVYLCVPETHLLAKRESVYMSELKNEDFISLNRNTRWSEYYSTLFARADVVPRVMIECDEPLRVALVEARYGVALTCGAVREVDLSRANKYIPIADEYAVRKAFLYYNPRQHMPAAAKAFLKYCTEYYQDFVQ